MKVVIAGSRGIPANYGGFETFAEELGVNLQARDGFDVSIICDADQREVNNSLNEYKGVKLVYAKYSKGRNPVLFYLHSFILAVRHSDIILTCGVGGGYWSFIPRLFNKILVTNPDGVGWKRSKWSFLQKLALRTMYYTSVKFSNYFVCDSVGITALMKSKYSYSRSYTIEYGAYINSFVDIFSNKVEKVLSHYGLESQGFHLVVSRLEPENNVDMIIKAYLKRKRKYQLVIVGNLQKTEFVRDLQRAANDDVIFLGGIYDKDELAIVRANALDYIHGHSVGGTNPSLLEALASANICVCHDNIFNREVVRDAGYFFESSDTLSDLIDVVEKANPTEFSQKRTASLDRVSSYYNWDLIGDKYSVAFEEMLANKVRYHER